MSKHLPPHPNLKQLKIQAKDLLRAIHAADVGSIQRIKSNHPRLTDIPDDEILGAEISLIDCQHVVAREYGFKSWNWLRAFVEIDFELLLRFSDSQIQVLMCEVDNRQWMIALNSVGDDVDHSQHFSAELMAKVLGLMSEPLRDHIGEGIESLKSVSLDQLQEAQRHILQQADQLAAHSYISWPSGNQLDPLHELAGDISPFLLDQVRHPVEEMSIEDIAELSVRLTLQARREGILSLQRI